MTQLTPEQITLIIKVVIASILSSTGLFTLIIELIRRHDKKVEKTENTVTKEELDQVRKDLNLLKDCSLAGTRQDLLDLMRHYLNRGYITIEERETLSELMKCYEDLGGDGFIHDLYELVLELPLDKLAVKSGL